MVIKKSVEKSNQPKLEWISLVYLFIFVLTIMAPTLVKRGYFGFQQESIEEFLIFCFGLVGLGIFIGYNRLMEARMLERDIAIGSAELAKKELLDSYKYIGQINRQIEMLKTLSNQTSMTLLDADAYRKDIIQSIVSNAAATIGSACAVVRFIDVITLRTESEIYFAVDGVQTLKMSNKELRSLYDSHQPYVIRKTDDGLTLLAIASDGKSSSVHAFLIFCVQNIDNVDSEVSLLKVFVNQAELVFHTLQRKRAIGLTSPMQLVDAVTNAKQGDIS